VAGKTTEKERKKGTIKLGGHAHSGVQVESIGTMSLRGRSFEGNHGKGKRASNLAETVRLKKRTKVTSRLPTYSFRTGRGQKKRTIDSEDPDSELSAVAGKAKGFRVTYKNLRQRIQGCFSRKR